MPRHSHKQGTIGSTRRDQQNTILLETMVSSSASKPDEPSSPILPGCILFRDEDRTVYLVDIPTSIEESQILPEQSAETNHGGGAAPRRRLLSDNPIAAPYPLPEPRNTHVNNNTPASQLADLMIEAAVNSALDTLKEHHAPPFCLPRVIADEYSIITSGGGEDDRSAQQAPTVEDASQDAAAAHFIPAASSYLSGSIEETREAFVSTAPSFDLIVMDPPWANKSAKRKRGGYATVTSLDETRLLLEQIPVGGHLADGGLVAVWITNKASLVHLLTSPRGILAGWGLELAAEWIWIKITSQGEPIFDTESAWRKPWERLIVAKKRGDRRKIPQRVIAAVPDVHSRKPNLRVLFEDLLPPGFRGLEVFARNLTAGWWGWGNEVLRFQERHHWVATPQAEESSEPDDTN